MKIFWKFSLDKNFAKPRCLCIAEIFGDFANAVKVTISSMQSLTQDKKFADKKFRQRKQVAKLAKISAYTVIMTIFTQRSTIVPTSACSGHIDSLTGSYSPENLSGSQSCSWGRCNVNICMQTGHNCSCIEPAYRESLSLHYYTTKQDHDSFIHILCFCNVILYQNVLVS